MLEQIRTILSRFTDADLSGITEDTDILFDLGFDSLQVMNLATALEETFGVTVSDEDAASIVTVSDIIRLVS